MLVSNTSSITSGDIVVRWNFCIRQLFANLLWTSADSNQTRILLGGTGYLCSNSYIFFLNGSYYSKREHKLVQSRVRNNLSWFRRNWCNSVWCVRLFPSALCICMDLPSKNEIRYIFDVSLSARRRIENDQISKNYDNVVKSAVSGSL